MASESKQTNDSSPQPKRYLSRDDVIHAKWMLFNDNGYVGDMELEDNGKIKGYKDGNFDTWKLSSIAHGYTILEIYGTNKKRSTQFIFSIKDSTGMWKLHGPADYNKAWRHYLIQCE